MRAHLTGAELPQKMAQFCFSEALGNEGLDELAYREARAFTEMVDEPYKSAVARIADHPIWKILITGPALKSAPATVRSSQLSWIPF